MSIPASLFIVHHTARSSCNDFTSCAAEMPFLRKKGKKNTVWNWYINCISRIKNLKKNYLTTGWSDISYNFLVGEDGAVYEGRGWNPVRGHIIGYMSNHRRLAVAVMGNFINRKPNAAALNALKNLIKCGINLGYITSTYKLYGHRDVSWTACPGDALYKEIKTWPRY